MPCIPSAAIRLIAHSMSCCPPHSELVLPNRMSGLTGSSGRCRTAPHTWDGSMTLAATVMPPHASADDRKSRRFRPRSATVVDMCYLRELVFEKRILLDQSFDEPSILADGHDDAAISRYLSTRDQEVSGVVVLLQESDVRGHVGVNVRERGLVDKFDHEHAAQLAPNCARRKGKELRAG